MQHLDTRLQSFNAITKPKSKVKPAFPLTEKTHPNLTPDLLSQAGFYHTPGSTEESWDNCKCFMCNLELGGWDEGDDPFEEHSKRGNCAWADMVCTVKIEKRKRDRSDGAYTTTYGTEESLPQSKESALIREQTFKKWWPHKQKSGWLPTVKNLAQAGFIYYPSSTSKDTAMCPYCEYAVEGWEATDDPWQVHQSKVPDCHFFRAGLANGGPSKDKSTKAAAKPKKSEASRRTKRATTAASRSVVPEPEGEPTQATNLPSKPESITVSEGNDAKNKATKPRSTTTRRKTAARGKKKEDSEEVEAEPEAETQNKEVDEPEVIVIGDDTITSISQTQLPATISEEEIPVEDKEKKGKAKKATKAKPRATTAKSKGKKKKVEEQEGQTEDEVVMQESETEGQFGEEPESIPQPRLRQPSKPASQNKSPSSKPLPPLPPASPISPRPLSQLDRFTNIPPSSPIPSVSLGTPKPKSLLRSTQPSSANRPSPHSQLSREALDSSLTRGAIEARKVMEDLIASPIINTNIKNDREKMAEGKEEVVKLTEEQKKMTLEDLIRMEMKNRYREMQKEGEEMIERWEEKARNERKKIEAI
ncbi:hypothetical protein L486_03231 [Kwoniella mangroviensis CBS 10435]|uniref:BIR-domain-containing protein n=1 Tax=Kwoniella mangroviensis CBS 10435 TaxID=1331196 RepID=A0A1B9IT76_9TREE|nr:hypothetical protein L486_03231 [Kwoniella mangroviensis CBS 10435]OCF77009.1 hypothetical protein I204_02718 [Kwoniella mangroviensis CBS 8886]